MTIIIASVSAGVSFALILVCIAYSRYLKKKEVKSSAAVHATDVNDPFMINWLRSDGDSDKEGIDDEKEALRTMVHRKVSNSSNNSNNCKIFEQQQQ